MTTQTHELEVPVPGGAVPTILLEPHAEVSVPGLVVVPSIFGPAPDLIERLSRFADRACIAVPDPFWRQQPGVVEYGGHARAVGRLQGFDLAVCSDDLRAVIAWTRERCGGPVSGLGICFGGPFVLRFAAEGLLDGVVTWHGSRMENVLKRASEVRCPLRLHFGSDDPITPPSAIETIRKAFDAHPDVSIVVHPGAVHGFSHDGPAYDEVACRASLDAVAEILALTR